MKICVFTGTRAEYGLLKPLIIKLKNEPSVILKLLVSGTHLSPEFGNTIQQIVESECIETVEMLLSSDSNVGVAKSFGLGVLGYADALNHMRPDYCIIAGDRYEALACAVTCVMLSIPVVHLHGGEISEGSLDEYFRHAITKLSRLHFTSTEEYRNRVIQMGEDPSTVFNVGAIGLDNLNTINYFSREELEASLGIKFKKYNLLITYHPEHISTKDEVKNNLEELLSGLLKLDDTLLIFTKSNADVNGRIINELVKEAENSNPGKLKLFENLGVQRYFSLMKIVDAVVGNSSSGILEAPSFGIPTVNVGRRQDGRIRAESVIDCSEKEAGREIQQLLAVRGKYVNTINPYGDGKTADKIIELLMNAEIKDCVKKFFNIKESR